jgi:hypothetical protein
VYFYNEENSLIAIPTAWTDAAAPDPFVAIAAGRACFRTEDLIQLAELVVFCKSKTRKKRVRATSVKEKTPHV